jgi:hypothetical protein
MISPEQFQHIDDVSQIPAETRRLASFTARKEAAQRNATSWALQSGDSYVRLSRSVYRDPIDAEQHAYLMSTGKNNPRGANGVRHIL